MSCLSALQMQQPYEERAKSNTSGEEAEDWSEACTQQLIMISFTKLVFSTGKEQGKEHRLPQSTQAPSVVWSWKRANGTLEQLGEGSLGRWVGWQQANYGGLWWDVTQNVYACMCTQSPILEEMDSGGPVKRIFPSDRQVPVCVTKGREQSSSLRWRWTSGEGWMCQVSWCQSTARWKSLCADPRFLSRTATTCCNSSHCSLVQGET